LNKSEHSFRQPFFIIVGIIAIAVIFFLFRSVAPDRLFLVSALSFIVGGAAGNIVDRLRYGYVVDFIHWRPGFDWPTFNIADALIVVGVIMMLIEFIRDHVRQRRAEKEEEGAPA
jgi:signal peptidase II